MPETIILNLDRPEYFDDFKVDPTEDSSELWQFDAKAKLVALLGDNCRQAAQYQQKRNENNDYFAAAHNAICISGGRGAGKTVFMAQCRKYVVKRRR